MQLIEESGSINGFVYYVQHKRSFVKSPRSALMLSYIIGVVIFVESSITSLVAGAVGKPLCDRYKIPHAKLAFVCDSTSAPVSSLIALNGWGALLLGLILTQIDEGILQGNAIDILLDSLLYNFYAMSALVVTFVSVWFNINIGSMKNATLLDVPTQERVDQGRSMYFMIVPIVMMVLLVFVFLYITGDGNILKGSGSSTVFYTMLVTWLFTLLYYLPAKVLSFSQWLRGSYIGAKKLLSVVLILLFAFAIGKITLELHTGLYLASLASENLSVSLLSGVIFLLSSIMAFATGTSWGTFSIMIPVAVPMAVGMDANVALAIGAVISGGVFGDHCSPISDTTIISSIASDCEVIEHVKTQLPYALISGVIALLLFLIFS